MSDLQQILIQVAAALGALSTITTYLLGLFQRKARLSEEIQRLELIRVRRDAIGSLPEGSALRQFLEAEEAQAAAEIQRRHAKNPIDDEALEKRRDRTLALVIGLIPSSILFAVMAFVDDDTPLPILAGLLQFSLNAALFWRLSRTLAERIPSDFRRGVVSLFLGILSVLVLGSACLLVVFHLA